MMIKTILIHVLAVSYLFGAQTKKDILKNADERIQKYRAGQVALELKDHAGKPLQSGQQINIEQTRHAFLFGCNIFALNRNDDRKLNEAYARRFAELLNFATVGFYWWAYEKEKGHPKDDRTEEILKWCDLHRVTPKGHPLAWNWIDPHWLPDDPDTAMKLQLDRIKRCVSKFSGRLDIWDVVNEATQCNREGCKKNAPILTGAIERMGVQTYLKRCFQAARQANPKATLIINDYITSDEYAHNVIDKLVDEKGQPLYDIIGIQCHQHAGAWSAEKTWEICERFAKYGKPLHFTEATILSGPIGWGLDKDPNFKWLSTPEGEQRQAKQVKQFYTVLFSHPAVEAITWWDFSDLKAWKRAPAGLLRKDMTPKPAYNVLKDLIKGKWWTRTQTEVDTKSRASFRGFYGDYKVTVISGGRKLTGTFTFNKNTKGPIQVSLK